MRQAVIGVGNEFQGDDGIGRHVIRELRGILPSDVLVVEEQADAANLMEAWKDADHVIIIDAMVSGALPGTIMRFNAAEMPLPREIFPHFSTHSYSVAESVELARLLDRLPARVTVYGIEGKQFKTSEQLSNELLQKTQEIVKVVVQEINAEYED